jgi:prolyl oligopeptidase
VNVEPEGIELFFSFASFFMPKAVYRLDLATLEYTLLRQQEVPFDAKNFELKQVWYESSDKTRIPLFLLHRKGLTPDGATPTMLYGYGGFGVSVVPSFNPHLIPFLEQGGIYALANIRGGGEFGEAWHQAGIREKRQKVFDDFIAAAEWLIAAGYTSADHLGCYGWSNGGLLVNGVAVQRPDLWRAVVAGGPVTDLLRFHTSTRDGGKHWVADYGAPDDPDDLRFLLKLSPYHNVPNQIKTPAMLFIIPEDDDRVAPWHGRKMLARLQAANTSDRPLLLRGEEKAGHNGGTSANKTLELYTDIWTFIFWQLGVI